MEKLGRVLYLDTEFNGFGGELISLALVSPEGEQFYMVRECESEVVPWVEENVIPVLGLCEEDRPATDSYFRLCFQDFIEQFKNPTIVCDWHADASFFCSMLEGEDYGSSLDFPFSLVVLKTPPGQPVSKRPHNALADAKALMEWHQSLKQAA